MSPLEQYRQMSREEIEQKTQNPEATNFELEQLVNEICWRMKRFQYLIQREPYINLFARILQNDNIPFTLWNSYMDKLMQWPKWRKEFNISDDQAKFLVECGLQNFAIRLWLLENPTLDGKSAAIRMYLTLFHGKLYGLKRK